MNLTLLQIHQYSPIREVIFWIDIIFSTKVQLKKVPSNRTEKFLDNWVQIKINPIDWRLTKTKKTANKKVSEEELRPVKAKCFVMNQNKQVEGSKRQTMDYTLL